MKSKTLILLGVALVCGLAASYMTSRLLADRSEKVNVLIAKQKYAPWTPIKSPEDQFDQEERLKTEVPKTAVVKYEALKDHVLIKGIDKGEVVVAENLLSKDKGGLEVLLPQGKRAVAIRTTAEKVAGGFVLPGSRVDIFHTIRHGDKESESRVILQNILVRAVDQQSMKPDDKPGLVPATVTLEVTPQQGLALARIQDVGSITLALRPYGDDHVANGDYAPPPPPPPPPPPKKVVVETPKPVVERNTLVIQNGFQWIRATYTTQNGETSTAIERSQSEAAAVAPAPPREEATARTQGQKGSSKE
jgi:Flp pilus assembly protein CpaB